MDPRIEDLKELLKRRKKYLKSLLKKGKYGYNVKSEVERSMEEIRIVEKSLEIVKK